jgi:eukaryotic-like serine/threonine-protein kinase
MPASVSHHLDRLQAALADRYTLGRELGRGGMAQVYLARDLRHDRDVAIKILRPELASSLADERFLREIQIEARFQHPHILPVHESGSAGDFLYCVMPFVAGETLRERITRERQLPLEEALRITREVGDALGYAHERGVVHRDIKPGNILLSQGHAVVADFGIARAISAAGGEQLTESGLVIGTPEYMSPEQASGDSSIDGRSDVYALACVLYEMLAGEPPFRGRTAQAVLARQRSDAPPSLHVVRPNVPDSVQDAIEIALAKVPADRFATVGEFIASLESARTGSRSSQRHVRKLWRRRLAAAGVAVTALVGVWLWRRPAGVRLDPNRVVVFPLRETGLEAKDLGAGENVATLIGYALEGTQPLTWLDGWDFLDERQRTEAGQVLSTVAREISRARHARYFLDGAIVGGPDTVTVVLRLHDVAGDSIIKRTGASAPSLSASLPQLGLRAVSDLLPALLAPGQRVDLSALSERKPAAVANFLQGEREYRRMRFTRALDYYRAAVREDSALALAALKGAQAANWPQVSAEDQQLVEVALQRESLLPRRQALFARGLRDYFTGAADSAVRRLTTVVQLDSTWGEAWMALGEVYFHLLPDAAPLDSLAEAAFERARLADSSFTPPLLHLAEIAIRRGDVGRADTLVAAVRRAGADSGLRNPVSLMVQCVRAGARSVDWAGATRHNALDVLAAGKLLAVGASQPACGEAAFNAVLHADPTLTGERWGALLGLQSLWVALGRSREVSALLTSESAAGLPGRLLFLLDAGSGAGFHAEARTQAEALGREYERLDTPRLWLLGGWAARIGDSAALAAIVGALETKRDSSQGRRDSLVAAALAARLPLLAGDSNEALRRLEKLRATAPGTDIEWQFEESLGEERMILAELLLARRRFADALRVASQIDSPQPLVYLLHLRRSLEVRARAAEAMGRVDLTARYRSRLRRLDAAQPVMVGIHRQ